MCGATGYVLSVGCLLHGTLSINGSHILVLLIAVWPAEVAAAAQQQTSHAQEQLKSAAEQLQAAKDAAADLRAQLAARPAAPPPSAQVEESEQARQLRAAQNQLKQAQMELQGVSERLEVAEQGREDTRAALQLLQTTRNDLQQQLEAATAELAATKTSLAEQQAALQAELEATRKEFEEKKAECCEAITAGAAARTAAEQEKARADAAEQQLAAGNASLHQQLDSLKQQVGDWLAGWVGGCCLVGG
jgi:chromosome segregation ATPase